MKPKTDLEMARKGLGQYFTPRPLADYMVGLAQTPVNGRVLEPASGEGVFIDALLAAGYHDITAYEVDPGLVRRHAERVRLTSFVSAEVAGGFDLAIGNPPYIRWKHLSAAQKSELQEQPAWRANFNSLCDYHFFFILKAVELLKPGGEAIFITPDYWLTTTQAGRLRDYLAERGAVRQLVRLVETPVFSQAATSTVILRYEKSRGGRRRRTLQQPEKLEAAVVHSRRRLDGGLLEQLRAGQAGPGIEWVTRPAFLPGETWMAAGEAAGAAARQYGEFCQAGETGWLEEVFQIGSGLVSGLDRAFRIAGEVELNGAEQAALIRVVKARQIQRYRADGCEYYFYLNGLAATEADFQAQFPHFFAWLAPYKERLLQRYSYQRPRLYWEWAFPRNLALFQRPQARLLAPGKQRISTNAWVRFAYAPPGSLPTQDVVGLLLRPGVPESLYYWLAWLNSAAVFAYFKDRGILKGQVLEFSERPLANLPVRRIDWRKPEEVHCHAEISRLCQAVVEAPGLAEAGRREGELNTALAEFINQG